MKKFARNLILSGLSFFVIALFYKGIHYQNLEVLAFASLVFALLTQFVKPILKLLALPFNILTFGFFSSLSSIIIIYFVSFLVSGFTVVSFHFSGLNLSGFILPPVTLTWFFSALLAGFLIGLVTSLMQFFFR